MAEAAAYTTFEAFLEQEKSSERRHELVGGRVYMLAGGSERHDLMAGLLYEKLVPGARANGCRAFASNRLVRTRCGSAYHPDVMVVCARAPDPFFETDPILIVEVLSPSTQAKDRREKAVAQCAVVSPGTAAARRPGHRRVEAARPADGQIQDWQVYGPGDVISTGFGNINVDECNDIVDRSATAS